VELLPWTAMPPAMGSQHKIALYSNVVPQLGTKNGEYHIELRATDQFDRTSMQGRCWNHVILAPPLNPTTGTADQAAGEKASGFQPALFSPSLNPGPSETADFTTKFLNSSPAGAAVWRTRFKNYLGLPVYVTVQVSQNVNASISREFRIMNSLID